MRTTETKPRPIRELGAGMPEAPELVIRQVLTEGLVRLAGDDFRMEELFARYDDLLGNSTSHWVDDMRQGLLSLVTPGRGGLRIGVGWPNAEQQLPYVSIIPEAGSSDDGAAVMNDIHAVHYEQIGVPTVDDWDSARTVRHETRGEEWMSVFQVGSWTVAPEWASMLHTCVHQVLLFEKDRAQSWGIRDVAFAESGFEVDTASFPRTPYVPLWRMRTHWLRRHTRRVDPVPTRARLRTATFYNG